MSDLTLASSTVAKTSASPLVGTDILRVVRTTTSMKATLANVATYVASVANTWSLAQTFNATVSISAAAPTFDLRETGVAADAGNWRFQIDGTILNFYVANDALNAATAIYTVTRSTMTPTDFKFGCGVTIGSPTGGNKGAGTLNAVSVYDDNVVLTDLVLDLAAEGSFDHEKYKNHPLACEVKSWWFNPDAYAAHWREARCLPGMLQWSDPANKPSTGESITRLTAVVETQAVHIDNLNQRIKALETA